MHILFLRNQTIFDTCELCRTLIFIATYAQKEKKLKNTRAREKQKEKQNKHTKRKEL